MISTFCRVPIIVTLVKLKVKVTFKFKISDKTPWSGFMAILKEGTTNAECFLYSITLLNKVKYYLITNYFYYNFYYNL